MHFQPLYMYMLYLWLCHRQSCSITGHSVFITRTYMYTRFFIEEGEVKFNHRLLNKAPPNPKWYWSDLCEIFSSSITAVRSVQIIVIIYASGSKQNVFYHLCVVAYIFDCASTFPRENALLTYYRIILISTVSRLPLSSHFVFTAQCTLVHMRGLGIACRPSVCLCVTLVDCDHIS